MSRFKIVALDGSPNCFTKEDLEVATSHTNHMSALNQEYAMAIQGFMSGFGINAKEQGATQNIMVRGEQ